ncbi:25778_t:CDS:1, partial [Gigaspora rosea]
EGRIKRPAISSVKNRFKNLDDYPAFQRQSWFSIALAFLETFEIFVVNGR